MPLPKNSLFFPLAASVVLSSLSWCLLVKMWTEFKSMATQSARLGSPGVLGGSGERRSGHSAMNRRKYVDSGQMLVVLHFNRQTWGSRRAKIWGPTCAEVWGPRGVGLADPNPEKWGLGSAKGGDLKGGA